MSDQAAPAYARKVALIIGNNDYRHLPKLRNAVNDARLLANRLSSAGYEIELCENIRLTEFNRALKIFRSKLVSGSLGVLWYSGHGVQSGGRNYLIPVNAELYAQNDLHGQSVSLTDTLDRFDRTSHNALLVFIDACRRDLFLENNTRDITSATGLNLAHTRTPQGTYIVYSAGSNQAALDSLGRGDDSPNGLFARELIPRMTEPGVDVETAFKQARRVVRECARSIGKEQDPAYYNELSDDVCLIEAKTVSSGNSSASPTNVVETDTINGSSPADVLLPSEAPTVLIRSPKWLDKPFISDAKSPREAIASHTDTRSWATWANEKLYTYLINNRIADVAKIQHPSKLIAKRVVNGFQFVTFDDGFEICPYLSQVSVFHTFANAISSLTATQGTPLISKISSRFLRLTRLGSAHSETYEINTVDFDASKYYGQIVAKVTYRDKPGLLMIDPGYGSYILHGGPHFHPTAEHFSMSRHTDAES